ncbi:MAG: 3-phosphoshikimate 1-carboxyvinyltransferase [Deltaproteobacteria bacterium RIFCSPHIGHO2_12_FULL_43_9]|nr:MAG: 3-phosphoshikimate 1-carboxyvinyltransferase [Deltaproteobacteria bacterium RIFCSPHIGHO2_12_FULL_43_9]
MSIKSIFVPGDKSISHRVLILSAIADRPTVIRNLNRGEDVGSTIKVLRGLGARIEQKRDFVLVTPRPFSKPKSVLDCGNSGTTMRLMAGLLASSQFPSELSGDRSLLARPMERVVIPINKMGGRIQCSQDGNGPIKILPALVPLKAIDYKIPVPSAQVKGAILLAGLGADGKTTVTEKIATRNHTELWLRSFGVGVEVCGLKVSLNGGVRLKSPGEVTVPGDPTAAAYLAIAALITRAGSIKIENVALNPGRIRWVEILRGMGADIDLELIASGVEDIGNIVIHNFNKGLKPVEINAHLIPDLIDEIPALAVLMARVEGTSIVRGAMELRVKESDRVKVIYEGFRRLGIDIDMFDDGFSIKGGGNILLRGGRVNSYGDHRMAMAFGLCNLMSDRSIYINGKNSVVISFPGFFRELNRPKNWIDT